MNITRQTTSLSNHATQTVRASSPVTAGPARLLTLMWREILESPKLTLMAKVHLVVLFFGMRPCVQFLPNALLFAVVIPAAVLVPADPASFGAPLALLHAIPLLWWVPLALRFSLHSPSRLQSNFCAMHFSRG